MLQSYCESPTTGTECCISDWYQYAVSERQSPSKVKVQEMLFQENGLETTHSKFKVTCLCSSSLVAIVIMTLVHWEQMRKPGDAVMEPKAHRGREGIYIYLLHWHLCLMHWVTLCGVEEEQN